MLNAVTVTSNGDPTFELYVCVGVESDVEVVVSPSPQTIVYLLAFPVAVIVSVTTVPAPPLVVSAVKSTSLTNVLFLTFSTTSFKSSIASVTLVDVVQLIYAPSVVNEPSAADPKFIALPI